MNVLKVAKGTIASSVLLASLFGAPAAFAAEKTNPPSAVNQNQSAGYKIIDATPSVTSGDEVGTDTHYEYDVPAFSLAVGEGAFTTRSGYGFVLNDDTGLDYDDIDVTFNVTGTAVDLEIAVIKYSDWANTANSTLLSNLSSYAVGGVKSVTAAGSGKSVSFYDLPYNTYIVVWKNKGKSSISINSGHIATSW